MDSMEESAILLAIRNSINTIEILEQLKDFPAKNNYLYTTAWIGCIRRGRNEGASFIWSGQDWHTSGKDLVEARYHFIQMVGVNRYYVADEKRKEMDKRFNVIIKLWL